MISDSAIDSIHVFSEIDKVLVVSDGYIHFVDMELVKSVKKISALKGVKCVARRLRSNRNSNDSFTKMTVGGGEGGIVY